MSSDNLLLAILEEIKQIKLNQAAMEQKVRTALEPRLCLSIRRPPHIGIAIAYNDEC